MKRFYIVGILIGLLVIGGIALSKDTTEYEAVDSIVTVEKEVEVSTLEKRLNDALEANSEAIEAQAQAAYDAAKRQAEAAIELEVVKTFQDEVEALETELEKEIGVF